jgi:uncharacterized protein DUF5684
MAALFASSWVGVGIGIGALVYVAIVVFEIAALWKVFVKGGRPGWAAIIPFYNTYTMLKVVGRPGWWLILYFIPLVNLIVWLIVAIDLARSFGKGSGYGVAIFFLAFIFIPILGFGSAQYTGPAAGGPRAIDVD